MRDFQQIAGRAGRKGFDDHGTVVVQAPEHVIENMRHEQKAAGDAKKLKKLVKKKPPEKGYVPWDKETFDKLVGGAPEPLSRASRSRTACCSTCLAARATAARPWKLIRDCHESPAPEARAPEAAFQLFRSLVDRHRRDHPAGAARGRKVRVNVDLQEDFSLNQALSLYLLDTLKLLDRESPDYALDVLTLVESILENPELVLRKQLDRLKTEKIAELKAAGVEYDERMAELEKLEYPKPNRDFIYDTFNAFAAAHPWVGQENIRPKSIAREMYEQFSSFDEYIRDYELQRAEGLLLRYLSEVYKALVQTVPDRGQNDEIEQIIDVLRRPWSARSTRACSTSGKSSQSELRSDQDN